MTTTEVKFGPLTGAAMITGAGLGGILDVAVFHQILQLHQILSSKIGDGTLLRLKVNLFWDGIALFLALTIVTAGIISLWKVLENPYTPRSMRVFYGSLLMGWGIFITLEGIVNHVLLEIHHVLESVNPDRKFFWDAILIIAGVLIAWGGKLLVSNGKKIFFLHEVQNSRKRRFRFRPAFNRQRALRSKVASIHRHTHASNSSL